MKNKLILKLYLYYIIIIIYMLSIFFYTPSLYGTNAMIGVLYVWNEDSSSIFWLSILRSN